MIIPAYSILPANVTKNHVLRVEPHFLIIIHPDWLINTTYLADSNVICMEIIQADAYFEKACSALVILNIKWNSETTK